MWRVYLERCAFLSLWCGVVFMAALVVAGYLLVDAVQSALWVSVAAAQTAHAAQWVYLVAVAGLVGCSSLLFAWRMSR